ncbi:MAG: hypothetical protein AB1480_07905 [Nitrospirota bacterium]
MSEKDINYRTHMLTQQTKKWFRIGISILILAFYSGTNRDIPSVYAQQVPDKFELVVEATLKIDKGIVVSSFSEIHAKLKVSKRFVIPNRC